VNFISLVAHDHYRLGYARQLLWLDTFFLLWIAVDLGHYAWHGLALRSVALWAVDPRDDWGSFTNILLFLLFLIVIAPLMIAFLRVVGLRGTYLKGWLARSPGRVLLTHTVICLLFVYFFYVTRNMQTLSGLEEAGAKGLYRSTIHPLFYSLVASHSFSVLLGAVGTLAATAGAALASFILVGKEPASALKQYLVRASLADLPTELRPVKVSGQFGSPQPSALVKIEYVVNTANSILRKYEKLSPGSQSATRYLDAEFEECRKVIREKLIKPRPDTPNSGIDSFAVDLFTGTKRALQAAIAQVDKPDLIVVLPFATPSLANFMRWHALLTGHAVKGGIRWGRRLEENQNGKRGSFSRIEGEALVVFSAMGTGIERRTKSPTLRPPRRTKSGARGKSRVKGPASSRLNLFTESRPPRNWIAGPIHGRQDSTAR